MKTSSTYILALLVITVALVNAGDHSFCKFFARDPTKYRTQCYIKSTYDYCPRNCSALVISKKYKENDCPWGDAPNARNCNKINDNTSWTFCRRGIDNANPNSFGQIVGMNCCGTCMETSRRTAPIKPKYILQRYPGVYPVRRHKHRFA